MRNWPDWLPHLLAGLVIGAALGILAAFFGRVRTGTSLLLWICLLTPILAVYNHTRPWLYGGSAAVALLLWICLLTPILRGPVAALAVYDRPQPADVIVVLGSGIHCGSAELSANSQARLLRGLELWQQQLAPAITLSEQSNLLSDNHCLRLNVAQERQISRLFPSAALPQIFTLRNVTTTRDEAARLRVLAQQQQWDKVILVTSPSHSRRAKQLVSSYLPTATIISLPASEVLYDNSLPMPLDRLAALRTLAYEWLSRLKSVLGATPER